MPDGATVTPRVSGGVSGVEILKRDSRGLRGDIVADLASSAPEVSEGTYNLLKFHGSYEQHDRDTATARKQAGLAKEFSFMARVKMPAGQLTGAQWLALDRLADEAADGTLRITTRQAIQFHHVGKGDLRALIGAVERAALTTYGACGDVVRNVITTPAPMRDAIHARLQHEAHTLSAALLPRSRSHYEIFVDGEALPQDAPERADPIYGATYLPRKFKIGLAHPSDNTVDVLANDLGLIGVWEGERLQGWIVALGGGLGMTHGRADTYPRLATAVAFVGPDDTMAAALAAIRMHRDLGDRGDRRRARLKYVMDDLGPEGARAAFAERFEGTTLTDAPSMPALQVPDLLGWHEQGDGRLWLGIPVPSGRVADRGNARLRTALRELVTRYGAEPALSPAQDILLGNLRPADVGAVEAMLRAHGVALVEDKTPVERWSLACPALPTCGLALSEAERVQDTLIGAIHAAMVRYGLGDEKLAIRITGCPNGCARPYVGDIGIVGRMPGHYALFVGGDFEGTRLNWKLRERLKEADVAPALEPLFAAFAAGRQDGEGFGNFCERVGQPALDAMLADAGFPERAPSRRGAAA